MPLNCVPLILYVCPVTRVSGASVMFGFHAGSPPASGVYTRMSLPLLLKSTVPSGTCKNLPWNAAFPLFPESDSMLTVFVAGSYKKNVVGEGQLHTGPGLAANKTLPFVSSTPGASIGNMVFPPLSFSVGPFAQVPARAGFAFG